MRNWWQHLSEPKRAGLVLVLVLMGLILGMLLITYEHTTDGITFDYAKQEIRPKLSFGEWLADWWGPGERYVVLYEKVTLVGLVNNVAYKAKFYLPADKRSVKKFLVGTDTKSRQFQAAVSACITSNFKLPFLIAGQTQTVRAISISNMNELCPLAPEYGYQWQGDLEIAQCFVEEVKDPWQKQFCLDLVDKRH